MAPLHSARRVRGGIKLRNRVKFYQNQAQSQEYLSGELRRVVHPPELGGDGGERV